MGKNILVAKTFEEIDFNKLMELYAESNMENASYFSKCKGISKEEGLKLSHNNFESFLKEDFFANSFNGQNIYFILEEDGIYICAVRLEFIRDNVFYLEGLETNPKYRKQGMALKLYRSMDDYLKKGTYLSLTINKENLASKNAHEKAGFINTNKSGFSDFKNGIHDERTLYFYKVIE